MAEHKLTETQTQEIRQLYLHRAKETPPAALDAEILALSRQQMSEQQADQKPPKRGLSPWLWSSAASVLIIIGLSLYLPELNDPSAERPVMTSKPIMMHSIGSDEAIELSLSQTQEPPAVTPARQAEPVAAGKVNIAELAETLPRIEAYLAQGERDKARELYQSVAGKFARLADDNPEKRRFLQLGSDLGLVGSP